MNILEFNGPGDVPKELTDNSAKSKLRSNQGRLGRTLLITLYQKVTLGSF